MFHVFFGKIFIILYEYLIYERMNLICKQAKRNLKKDEFDFQKGKFKAFMSYFLFSSLKYLLFYTNI